VAGEVKNKKGGGLQPAAVITVTDETDNGR